MIYLIDTNTCFGIACPIDELDSYEKIYKIKKRDFSKPLAMMVEDFAWLERNTDLTTEQIDFLKNYERPFTILAGSTPMKHWLNYEDENGEGFRNKDIYKKVAFRVAHTKEQKELISEVGPIFLTSANLAGEGEIIDKDTLKEQFKYYLEKKIVELVPSKIKKDSSLELSSSDIFEFIGETSDINYLRKS